MSALRKQLAAAQSRMVEIADEIEAIGATAAEENRELGESDTKMIDGLTEEYNAAEQTVKNLTAMLAVKERLQAAKITPVSIEAADTSSLNHGSTQAALPAQVRRIKSKVYDSTADAYAVGKWLTGLLGNQHSRQWCIDRGMNFHNAMSEGTDTAGGFAVPDPMAARLIELVEDYGVFRRFASNVVASSDTLAIPKLSADTTVYYPAEGAAITPSDLTFAQVSHTLRKYAQLAIMSSEVSEDAIISMTDTVTRAMARQFASAEDTNSFLGDGSAGFGSITGIEAALAAGSTTSGTVTLANLETLNGDLKRYSGQSPVWFMHSFHYYNDVVPALVALGGTDMRQTEAGGAQMLYGYPVVFTQVLTGSAASTGDLLVVLGDLSMSASLATRRNVTVRVLNELYAANDQIGLVATMRSDTQIHDVGDASNAGGITALLST